MTDNNTNNNNVSAILSKQQPVHNNKTVLPGESNSHKILPIIIAVIIVIAIILAVYYITQKPSQNTTSTFLTTSIIPIKNTSNSSINATAPKARPFHEPQSYLTANAFANYYTFSSPLKYRFTAVFQPSYDNANCTALEGLVGYMQNETMVTKPYNISSLNHSEPVAESAAVLGINPSNEAEYSSLFNSNKGFCSASFAALLTNSTSEKTTYSYGNTTVYLFMVSNMTKQGISAFGSYTGLKPNLTVYIGSALYGSYRVKVIVAGFSSSATKLGLYGFAMNLTNSTISSLKGYLSTHGISP